MLQSEKVLTRGTVQPRGIEFRFLELSTRKFTWQKMSHGCWWEADSRLLPTRPGLLGGASFPAFLEGHF